MAEQCGEDLIHELIAESGQRIRSGLKGLRSKGKRFALSSQLWFHACPTINCDVLVTLPPNDPRSEFVITWLVDKIKRREPRLKIELRQHSFVDSYGLYLTANYENLLRGAEILHIKKRLKRQWGGGLREFVVDQSDYFEGVEHKGQFLTSRDRASIVLHFLNSIRANVDESIGGLSLREGQAIVPAMMNAGFISQTMPLHNVDQLKRLKDRWLTKTPQPLDSICEYFGEKIGMYFAWLSHYTKMLCAPGLFGFICWLFYVGGSQLSEDILFVALALFMVVWSTVFLEWWKRSQAEYAYKWGTLGMESDLVAESRSYYRGDLKISQISGRLEPSYPAWKRRAIRYCFSYPLTCVCLIIFFIVMLWVFEFQEITDKYFNDSTVILNWIIFVPKVALALVVFAAAELYTRFAYWLNDIENYRTEDSYENHLITKIVVFQVISSFLPVLYIAFVLGDMERLRAQLAALLITRQLIGNIQEAIVPLFVERFKLSRIAYDKTRKMSDLTLQKHVETMKETAAAKLNDNERSQTPPNQSQSEISSVNKRTINCETAKLPEFKTTGGELTQAEVESVLPVYTSPLEDYLEMFIQFGYVVLFSPAFPLAPLCCLINNVFEIRVDAFKLCSNVKRPFGKRVENIGAWQTCMELMGVVGILVNCCLIAQSGLFKRLFPGLTRSDQILFVVLLEHSFLLLRFLISRAIPDKPSWIKVEVAKVEYQRLEAFRRESRKVERAQELAT